MSGQVVARLVYLSGRSLDLLSRTTKPTHCRGPVISHIYWHKSKWLSSANDHQSLHCLKNTFHCTSVVLSDKSLIVGNQCISKKIVSSLTLGHKHQFYTTCKKFDHDSRILKLKKRLKQRPAKSIDKYHIEMDTKMIIKLLVVYIMAIGYGIRIMFHLIKLIITQGYSYVYGRKEYPCPAGLNCPSLGSHGFLHLDQVRIHYVASGPEDKPLMLFLHGFPEFWYSWRHQIKEFQKDYRCVAIDMRGYGESDKPVGTHNYTLPVLMNDVKQVIEALGHQTCILVVHDWGGIVGWAFASLYSNMVDKLVVLNAPPTPVMTKALEEVKEQSKMSWYIMFFQLPYLPEVMLSSCNFGFVERMFGIRVPYPADNLLSNTYEEKFTQEEVDAYKHVFCKPGYFTGPVNYYRALFLKRVTYDTEYKMPVLVLWGLKDFALHHSIPDSIEAMCDNVTLKRFPEAGHFIQMDIPKKVNLEMREWLNSFDST